MRKHLETTIDHLEKGYVDLRKANYECGPVESIVIMQIIERVCKGELLAKALLHAISKGE